MTAEPRTLLDKVWDAHVMATRPDGQALLAIDRHLLHEGSFHAFGMLDHAGRAVRRPDLTFAVADHYVPSRDRGAPIPDPEIATMVSGLAGNAGRHGIRHFGLEDPGQGIVHVIAPEQGLTLPGLTVVCGDSHTSTHGAFGALGFGIGATEVAHVLATQALWQRRPKSLRVTIDGRLGPHVAAKDVVLAIIAALGAGGAVGHVLEYAGSAIRGLSMEGRLTICNMSIEAGARAGMIAPDDTTFAFLEGRPFAPRGDAFARAVAAWRALPTDDGARFDREVVLEAGAIAPTVTWGTSPETAVPVTAAVPDPSAEADGTKAGQMRAMLDYMGLAPGTPLEAVAIDRVFIGSCTNSRIEDLRAAAGVLRGRRAAVPGLVVPGSGPVRRQAEAEGLDAVFRDAGLEWGEPGCSMCVGINGDLVPAGERCASTTNRNFPGRQGPNARTHLMSPAMAAAAALTGRLTDIRRLGTP
ncbi:3-isopropylmalate dehydratase large subunit [Methylobacterium crusticola]|uniref:3-isopropylmalate dehydratase large subunit n=1 Tax=Methylobacterium crusticola TaxID=1697972 RepID=A0ABQ4R4N9_9HYPH|nr:3-isopropylmalate dehydratase large subunit [Methylobacterium crusticola]GJD52104.1 3-isopropylmalate dehydratase large subunit [Methylobacterium crusticola]